MRRGSYLISSEFFLTSLIVIVYTTVYLHGFFLQLLCGWAKHGWDTFDAQLPWHYSVTITIDALKPQNIELYGFN